MANVKICYGECADNFLITFIVPLLWREECLTSALSSSPTCFRIILIFSHYSLSPPWQRWLWRPNLLLKSCEQESQRSVSGRHSLSSHVLPTAHCRSSLCSCTPSPAPPPILYEKIQMYFASMGLFFKNFIRNKFDKQKWALNFYMYLKKHSW